MKLSQYGGTAMECENLRVERDKLVGIVEKLLACFSRTSTTVTGAWEAYPGKNALPDALREAERLLAEIRGGK